MRKDLAHKHSLEQKGSTSVGELFMQGRIALDPQDKFTLGINFTKFAKLVLGEEEWAILQDPKEVEKILNEYYKDGWKPNDGKHANTKVGTLGGFFYSCPKHYRSSPPGSVRDSHKHKQCDCLPICKGCDCTLILKINTNRVLPDTDPSSLNKLRKGFGYLTMDPCLYCPNQYSKGDTYPMIGSLNNHCMFQCDQSKIEKNNGLIPRVIATSALRTELHEHTLAHATNPVEADKQLRRIAQRSLTIETIRWHTIARTYRRHSKGYDLMNPTEGYFDPYRNPQSAYQTHTEYQQPLNSEQQDMMEDVVFSAFSTSH